jgi:predicted DNA-binding protein with PD1-like motif
MNSQVAEEVTVENGKLGRLVLARLKPNQDLTESVEALCAQHGIARAVVRGAVGSLIDARLGYRAGDEWKERTIKGPGVEILNVFGEIGIPGSAQETLLHGVVADTEGRVYAGRFVRGGNLSFVTIEVTLHEWLPERGARG